jgi:SM-20-related protein
LLQSDLTQHIADALASQGWSSVAGFISSELVEALVQDADRLRTSGQFRAAAVGPSEQKRIDVEVRGDETCWLDAQAATSVQRECLHLFEKLRLTLNRELQLGLFDLEAHLACYPAGGFYRKHRDRPHATHARVVSCVLYLNPAWEVSDGGELRLYLDESGEGAYQDIFPQAGTLVCFLSDRFWHEVLPTRRERWSLTGWFLRR